MKTKLLLSFILLALVCSTVNAQVPQGFNYQAIARDGSNNPVQNTSMQVRLTIQSEFADTIFWKELHSSVMTNSFGLIHLVKLTGVKVQNSSRLKLTIMDG
jgi:hypothetical protein